MNSCVGTCEVCDCENEKITFIAKVNYLSKTGNICAMIERGKEPGSWSNQVWFPGTLCTFQKSPVEGKRYDHITAPRWLLETKGIIKVLEICTKK